ICNVSSRRLCSARCTGAATGKAGEALFLAPGLFEMFVWQDVSRDWLGRPRPIDARLQGDSALLGAAQGSRDRSTLPLFRLTGKAPVKITRAKALPSTGR